MIRILARQLIQRRSIQDSFYIVNLDAIASNINLWKDRLPGVEPFYAMKCNPDSHIMKLMKESQLGFDCASKKEMASVLNMGVPPDKVVFAHPCKKPSDIHYAKATGIQYGVFDSHDELTKLAGIYPNIKAILRIRIENEKARVQLGKKYGAVENEWVALLHKAHEYGIQVHGISFHIGSANNDPNVFSTALYKVRQLMDRNTKGHPISVIDIGGGFQKENFPDSSLIIQQSIHNQFGKQHGLRFIAEPGRFFVEDSSTFFTPIIGKRKRVDGPQEYWISDSLYGSMNCIIYDHHIPNYKAMRLCKNPKKVPEESGTLEEAIVWGSTCDSYDKVMEKANLPANLQVGDFLQFDNFGAYTLSGACDFNGINFSNPIIVYIKNNKIVPR